MYLPKTNKLKNHNTSSNNHTTPSNKGFTMVEVILVVVILAIILGTILVSMYRIATASRLNTDKNNANTISKVVDTLSTDDELIEELEKQPINTVYKMYWTEAQHYDTSQNTYTSVTYTPSTDFPSIITSKLNEILTDGLPESHSGEGYTLTFQITPSGVLTTCTLGQNNTEDSTED